MSLQLAAQHLSHQGRGPDDTLVHMSKNELKSLNDLAMAYGGQLTINPQTGLPEAGFLDKLMPAIVGAGLTYFSGGAINPMTAGFITGGIETVRSGSLEKGLMAGLGAYGGAGLTAGLMSAGEASLMPATGGGSASDVMMQQEAALNQQASLTNYDKLSSGASQLFKDPSKVMDSMGGGFNTMKYAGSAIAPLLGAEDVKANMPKTTTQPGKIRSYSYNPYGQTYTPTGNYEVPVTAADGGLMGMYDGYNPDQLNFAQRSEPVVRMADGGTPPPPQTVEDLYTTFLQRAPDTGGAEYWKQQFGNTIDQSEIDNFRKAANVEIANRPAATTSTGTTGGQTKPADTGGATTGGSEINFAPHSGAATTGGAVDMGAATGGAGFAPVNAGIQSLYQDILYRAPDAGGAEYWQKQFGDTVDATERATFMQAAKPEQQISNMYRKVLGRDPDPGGLQYWTGRLNAGESPDKLYSEFLRGARENTEMVTADDIKNKDFATATTPYTGYRSTDQTNVVDEWIRNTLKREPTEADKRQSWYRDAFNANKSISDTEKLYGDFQSFAKNDAASTTAQKIKDATASLTARGITEADVLRQTGKTIAELAASDIDFSKNLIGASQLMAPGTKAGFDFSTIRKPTTPTTPKTNAPVGTTNPYGNATNPGDITRNADGSTTVTPNIPYRPYGGFSGMGEVRDAYTQGGGSLGYIPYAPKTMEEFDKLYNKQTGGSKQAYDYLTGKTDYSATPYTKTGELMKPYFESVMGTTPNNAAKKVLFDPATKKYKTNPDYVPISYTSKGEKVYGLSSRDINSYLDTFKTGSGSVIGQMAGQVAASQAVPKWMTENNVTYEQLAEALGIGVTEAKKRYPATTAANGGLMQAYAGGGTTSENPYDFLESPKGAGNPNAAALTAAAFDAMTPAQKATHQAQLATISEGLTPMVVKILKQIKQQILFKQLNDPLAPVENMDTLSPDAIAQQDAAIALALADSAENAPTVSENPAALMGDASGDGGGAVSSGGVSTSSGSPMGGVASTGNVGQANAAVGAANAAANAAAAAAAAGASSSGTSSGTSSGMGGMGTGAAGAGVSAGVSGATGGASGGYIDNDNFIRYMATGGISSDFYNLGSYSDGGRLLRGPGDGVSDSIPAMIGKRQPARLADGEFVIPARIVSELGNGSTEAGARKLYAMMDRIQSARGKTVGKGKIAKNSRADKYLPK